MSAMTSRWVPVLLTTALALSACSGTGGDGGAGPTGSDTTPASSPSDFVSDDEKYGVDVPPGLMVTEPGSELAVGDLATIAWSPRAGVVGALRIVVTRLRQGTIKDFSGFTVDAATKASTPYYVTATVTNAGVTDLGGVDVPLYLVDTTDTLYGQNHFGGAFKPCAAKPLPKPFAARQEATVCLVFLVPDHGNLTAVSFRPSQAFDPITWTGTIITPKPSPTPKPSQKPSASPTS